MSEASALRHHCGVFAAWKIPEAAHRTYLGLFALQHRGQEGAGIVSSDGESPFRVHRGQGLVSNVFDKESLSKLSGNIAIGHVRYSTAGGNLAKNLQPLWIESAQGELAVAHNGNLTNALELRKRLESEGSVFQTTVDTEVIIHLMARAQGDVLSKLKAALQQIEGAYSLIVLARESQSTRLFAVKDPHGFRPLLWGRLEGGHVVASESCAFDLIGAKFEREIEPGEILEWSEGGLKHHRLEIKRPLARCVFEWIYFARPDSEIFGSSVYEMRKRMGAKLAELDKRNGFVPDVVIGVPDSGIPAALGYAQAAQVPFELGLIRNHYIGRTFIEPHQSIRDFSVKIKQNPLSASLKGKRIVVIDDSIVRGTTSKKINLLLRGAGAKEIHMRISAPPTVSPCYYGIDTPHPDQLIAANKNSEAIRQFVEADTLKYLDIQDLYPAIEVSGGMCDACFTKNYPTKLPAEACT